jgi:hypothetical protein
MEDHKQACARYLAQRFRGGNMNKLRLANRAIARFEMAADALELIL